MEINMIGIGNRIKARRNELGLTQTDIYRECGIASGALSKIENGKTTPSIIAFYRLSQVLECDMNWLATGVSSNLQSMDICKNEELILEGFRQLSSDDQDEIMEILHMKLRRVKRAKDMIEKSSNLIDGIDNMVG